MESLKTKSWQAGARRVPLKRWVSLATEDLGQATFLIKATELDRGRPMNVSPTAKTKRELGFSEKRAALIELPTFENGQPRSG